MIRLEVRSFLKNGLLITAFLVAGCSIAPNVEKVESVEPGTGTAIDKSQVEQKKDPGAGVPAHAPIVPRELEEQEYELAAVTYLLDQAETVLSKGEADRARAFSDRALQIDRKSARAYLILAYSHRLEKQLDRAIANARQGLLYTSEGSKVAQKLKELIQSSKY